MDGEVVTRSEPAMTTTPDLYTLPPHAPLPTPGSGRREKGAAIMNDVIDVLLNLRKLDGTFNKREQRVADFIKLNLDRATFMRQSEIAEAADVSVATVNRFCQTLGCDGFRDFQIWLARSVAVGMQYIDEPRDSAVESSAMVDHVFGVIIEGLSLARSRLTEEIIAKSATAIANARRIVVFGTGGSSSVVAQEVVNRLFRLGIIVNAYLDEYSQRMVASTLQPNDLVFVISATGIPESLQAAVTIARQYGAQTMALTRTDSPLAAKCDIVIGIDVPEHADIYKPTASRIVHLAVVDVIATTAARQRPEYTKETLRRVRTSLVPLTGDGGPMPIGD